MFVRLLKEHMFILCLISSFSLTSARLELPYMLFLYIEQERVQSIASYLCFKRKFAGKRVSVRQVFHYF